MPRRIENENKVAINTTKHFEPHENLLDEETGRVMVTNIQELKSHFFGLTSNDISVLTYKIAEKMEL